MVKIKDLAIALILVLAVVAFFIFGLDQNKKERERKRVVKLEFVNGKIIEGEFSKNRDGYYNDTIFYPLQNIISIQE